jgi:hypothetical protein
MYIANSDNVNGSVCSVLAIVKNNQIWKHEGDNKSTKNEENKSYQASKSKNKNNGTEMIKMKKSYM